MRAMRLLKAMSGADDELLTAYENDMPRPGAAARHPWRRWGLAAACLCLVIAGALLLPDRLEPTAPADHGTPLAEDKQQTEIINSYVNEDDPQSEACYITPEPGDVLYHIPVREAMERNAGSDAVFFVAIDVFDRNGQPLTANSPELAGEIERLTSLGLRIGWSEAWTYQNQGEQVPYTFLSGLLTGDELADFPAADSYGYALRFATNGDSSPAEPDLAVFGVAQEMELSQIYDLPELGAYLPASPPQGFAAEYSTVESTSVGGTTRVYALWVNGYDELSWQVYYYDPSLAPRLTAAEDTQNYDLSLYPIPRASSVPDELREIVQNPIFPMEELTLDVVMARAYLSGEPGDSDGYRMLFSVRYGDVVVEVSAKGVEPQWVYEQLVSLGE